MDNQTMYRALGIGREVYEFSRPVLDSLSERFLAIDEIAEFNQLKVLKAMQDAGVSEAHLMGTNGYGYSDIGRDALEKTYAGIFGTEDALVRSQIICGTHALALSLQANLRPGDEILSPIGKPYDTLEEVIGIRKSRGSLSEFEISYREVPLNPDGSFRYEEIRSAIHERTRLAEIQRSKGYSSRESLSPEKIGELIRFLKSVKPDLLCLVDNCYGEFVCREEPSEYGADMLVGSLIKNPGGGLAPVGGYIAGTKDCIENCAVRLSAPGLGKEVGPSLGLNRAFFQGIFLAPSITASAEKAAIFAASLYERLGFSCHPRADSGRNDIIQAIRLGSPEAVLAFCQGIQAASPVDSFVTPEPWEMPGYDAPVIMAAGAFIQGSSIELSADAPMKEPYNVYFQGGLTWPHAKFGIILSVQKLWEKGLVKL